MFEIKDNFMKKARIIILAGQSNAVGVGHVKYLDRHFSTEKVEEFKKGYDGILMNYYSHDMKSEGFVKTTINCAEKSKDTFGPEVGIADSLSKKYPDDNIFIVKCAVGGTNISHDWLSPSTKGEYQKESFGFGDEGSEFYRKAGWHFNELVKILGESIDILDNQGYEPEICAFCWMQGESDAFETDAAQKYGERYENLLKDLNKGFGEYMKNCVYIDAGISEIWPFYREINAYKESHAKETPNSFYIDTIAEGLTTSKEPEPEVDFAHYDSDCTIKLGYLFAEKIEI